jgi:hypothetical protein
MLAVLCIMLSAWLMWVLVAVCRAEDNSGREVIVVLLGNHEGSVEMLLRRLSREARLRPVSYLLWADEESKDQTRTMIDIFCRSSRGEEVVPVRDRGGGCPGHQGPARDQRICFDLRDYRNGHLIALALYGRLY